MKLKIKNTWKGKSGVEKAEDIAILVVLIGALMFSAGIGLNILNTKGFSTVLAMFGAFISFVGTIILISVWLLKEFFDNRVKSH